MYTHTVTLTLLPDVDPQLIQDFLTDLKSLVGVVQGLNELDIETYSPQSAQITYMMRFDLKQHMTTFMQRPTSVSINTKINAISNHQIITNMESSGTKLRIIEPKTE